MPSPSNGPRRFHEIPLARLSREGVVREVVDGLEILAVATPQGIRVYNGICPHLGGPLLEASLRDGVLRCPWHGYEFDVASARCRTAPGGPWRSLHGAEPEAGGPMEIELLPLAFDEVADRIRVHLGEPANQSAPLDDETHGS